MDRSATRVDPRVLRTRQLIKDAFIDLLQEMDIEKLSVNRIAERATINRVTFYLHYRDIPDMLEKMADEMMEEIYRILKSEPRPNFDVETEWPTMENLLTHIADNGKFFKVILATKRPPIFMDHLLKPLVEMITALIDRRMESDTFLARARVPREIAIWFCSASLIGTISAWLRADMPYTPRYLSKQFAVLLPHYFSK